MDTKSFDALISGEEAKLAELETAAVAAQAAEEGTARAIVTAKLDGKPAAELRRLESDADNAANARAAADRAVGRQKEQIAALRSEFAERSHRAELESTLAELETVRAQWSPALAAWDAWEAAGHPLWEELHRLIGIEQRALKKLERLDPAQAQTNRLPALSGSEFPISGGLTERLHYSFEAVRAEHLERKRRHEEWQQHVDSLPQSTGLHSLGPAGKR